MSTRFLCSLSLAFALSVCADAMTRPFPVDLSTAEKGRAYETRLPEAERAGMRTILIDVLITGPDGEPIRGVQLIDVYPHRRLNEAKVASGEPTGADGRTRMTVLVEESLRRFRMKIDVSRENRDDFQNSTREWSLPSGFTLSLVPGQSLYSVHLRAKPALQMNFRLTSSTNSELSGAILCDDRFAVRNVSLVGATASIPIPRGESVQVWFVGLRAGIIERRTLNPRAEPPDLGDVDLFDPPGGVPVQILTPNFPDDRRPPSAGVTVVSTDGRLVRQWHWTGFAQGGNVAAKRLSHDLKLQTPSLPPGEYYVLPDVFSITYPKDAAFINEVGAGRCPPPGEIPTLVIRPGDTEASKFFADLAGAHDAVDKFLGAAAE